jgi:hypothetical protein
VSSPLSRIEYSGTERCIIVTYASHVHESFKELFGLVVRIVDRAEDFTTETNLGLRLPDSLSRFTPDLGVRKKGSPESPKGPFRLIFECARAQMASAVEAKALTYFENLDVEAVVCLILNEIPQYRSPSYPPSPDLTTDTPFFARLTLRCPLAPVNFKGHCFGRMDDVYAIVFVRSTKNNQAVKKKEFVRTQCFHFPLPDLSLRKIFLTTESTRKLFPS